MEQLWQPVSRKQQTVCEQHGCALREAQMRQIHRVVQPPLLQVELGSGQVIDQGIPGSWGRQGTESGKRHDQSCEGSEASVGA